MPFVRRMTALWAALCGLAFAYSFAVMHGLEKEVPMVVPSEPMVRLLVWTWKWWSQGPCPVSLARVRRGALLGLPG